MARKQGDADLVEVIHKVESGDILYDIAQAYYGDGKYWSKIANANGIIEPGSLRIGQFLTIPCKMSLGDRY